MEEERKSERPDVGLVGGRIAERVENAKVPPLDLPHVLAPYRRTEDRAAFDAFVAHRPLHIEIGFGRPHHPCDLAALYPDANILGFEIRRRWVRDASKRAERQGLTNLCVVEGDARSYLDAFLEPGSVAALYVLFPDPWWKKKHHKRRIFQPRFLQSALTLLAPGGALIAKTDVEAYADLIDEQFSELDAFSLEGTSYADPILGKNPRSHREKKCVEMDIPIFQFRFVKT